VPETTWSFNATFPMALLVLPVVHLPIVGYSLVIQRSESQNRMLWTCIATLRMRSCLGQSRNAKVSVVPGSLPQN
jgi:hypothetical protein